MAESFPTTLLTASYHWIRDASTLGCVRTLQGFAGCGSHYPLLPRILPRMKHRESIWISNDSVAFSRRDVSLNWGERCHLLYGAVLDVSKEQWKGCPRFYGWSLFLNVPRRRPYKIQTIVFHIQLLHPSLNVFQYHIQVMSGTCWCLVRFSINVLSPRNIPTAIIPVLSSGMIPWLFDERFLSQFWISMVWWGLFDRGASTDSSRLPVCAIMLRFLLGGRLFMSFSVPQCFDFGLRKVVS